MGIPNLLTQRNNISPVAAGANQYIQSITPRLNEVNKMRNSTPIPIQVTNTPNFSKEKSSSVITDIIEPYIGNDTLEDIISGASKTFGESGATRGYGGLISGGKNGLSSFAQSGDYKDGLQGFFSIDKDDSDVMQGIKGTINGTVTGGSVGGPWGALAGGILGLGASFLDNI